MTFVEQLTITVIDKFVIGIFILVAGYFVSRALKSFESKQELHREIELSQTKAALSQIEAQIKEIYSPLYGLIQRSAAIYKLAKRRLPSLTSHISNDIEGPIWTYFVETYFLPLNAQMAELIHSKIHLVEEDELPESWRLFLEHQTNFELLHKLWQEKGVKSDQVQGTGWPDRFDEDVRRSLNRLRKEYNDFALQLKLPVRLQNK